MHGDFDFEPTTLNPEAYRYAFYMAKFGVTKARAKQLVRRAREERILISSAYQVNLTSILAPPPFGAGVWISLKRLDKAPLLDRTVLGDAMRALLPGHHGYELFPAPARLVDTSNQYHQWTFSGDGFLAEEARLGPPLDSSGEVFCVEGFEDAQHIKELRPHGRPAVEVPDWRELQGLKERYFPGKEAALFHATSSSHELNGRLFVLTHPEARWPFGFDKGLVGGEEAAARIGARQRALT